MESNQLPPSNRQSCEVNQRLSQLQETIVNDRSIQGRTTDIESLEHPPPAYQSTMVINDSSHQGITESELLEQAPPTYQDAGNFETYKQDSNQTEHASPKDGLPTYYATIARETEV